MHPLAREIHAVLLEYGIVGDAHVDRLTGGRSNWSYRVRTAGPSFVLRRYGNPGDAGWNRRRRTREAVAYEHGVLAHAAAGGIPCAAALSTPSGETVVEHNGRFFSLFPYFACEGASRDRTTGIEAAALLARLHRQMAAHGECGTHPLAGYKPRIHDWFHVQQAGLGTVEEIVAWVRGPAAITGIPDFVSRHVPYLESALDMVAAFPRDAYSRFPVVINHGDFQSTNLGVAGGRIAALFDFDDCQPDLRILDLCSLLADFAGRNWVHWDLERVATLLRVYREHMDIDGEELAMIPGMAVADRLHRYLCAIGIHRAGLRANEGPHMQRWMEVIAYHVDHGHELADGLATL